MAFRASFGNPFDPDVMELGELPADQVIDAFDKVPWADFLRQMEAPNGREIHSSPYLDIEHIETHHIVSISVAGTPAEYEYYIFYIRPKRRSYFFGLFSEMDKAYVTDKTGQTRQDAVACLEALLARNYAFLDQKIK